jgi:hypothetical protein
MLFNIGFVEALKKYSWDCFIFHDVDMYPEDNRLSILLLMYTIEAVGNI